MPTSKTPNSKIINALAKIFPVVFFSLAAVLILWQMLLPGYILTLDMVFTPEVHLFFEDGGIHNFSLVKILIKLFSFVLPVWLIQKIILFALFTALGSLAYYFLPLPKSWGARYFAGLFFMANPFVYERLLAGQWPVLAAYALLPVWVSLLLKFKNLNYRQSVILGILFSAIGVFSLPILALALIITAAYLIVNLVSSGVRKEKILVCLVKIAITSLVFLAVSSYWLLPLLSNWDRSYISAFGRDDLEAFATAPDQKWGIAFNVLSLHGFWGEAYPWADYFIWPKDFILYLPSFILLAAVMLAGAIKSFKTEKNNFIFFFISGFFAWLFALGINAGSLSAINNFLFENVFFWSGFRDSAKWIAFLALAFAYFGSYGAYLVLDFVSRRSKKSLDAVRLILIVLIVLYTFTIWGGFSRQLKPVWYPPSWLAAKDFLDADKSEYQAIFLPWHQYLSLDFNQQLVTLNPAKEFFGPKIIVSPRIEIGPVSLQKVSGNSEKIDAILTNNSLNSDQKINELKINGVKYVISYWPSGYQDQYPLGQALADIPGLSPVYSVRDLTIYGIIR